MPAKKNAEPSVAHIDMLAGRTVSGWVYDARDPAWKPDIVIRYGSTTVAEGSAAESRPDLKRGGFGDGEHGFLLNVDTGLIGDSVLPLEIVERDTGRVLVSNRYPVGGAIQRQVRIDHVSASGVSGTVSLVAEPSPSPIQPTLDAVQVSTVDFLPDEQVAITVDGELVAVVPVEPSDLPHQRTFRAALPARYLDGASYTFDAGSVNRRSHCDPLSTFVMTETGSDVDADHGARYRGFSTATVMPGYRYASLSQSLSRVRDEHELAQLQLVHSIVSTGPAARKSYPILTLPHCEKPAVSVVIPVYNQFALTYHCIASIVLASDQVDIEVIVVDDCSTDETLTIADTIKNLVVVRNETNVGFVRGCNRGAARARGDAIVFLNNDTEVTSGWLEEMLHTMAHFPNAGAVGSKLIYPDGVLQDAGGIVWNNGLPWNTGHGETPDRPEFNYTRDVDYLTGASLMVKASVWQQVDGFTDAYAPAYYEDTDLAFKIREAGYRTLYCPLSTVVHFEGRSNGTDTGSGIKQYQLINAEKFKTTWQQAFTELGDEGVDLQWHKDRRVEFRALVIDHSMPCEGQDAGSYAALQEMQLLIDLGAKVTFMPLDLMRLGKQADVLERMGVECISRPWVSSVTGLLERRGHEFDVVYITRYEVAESVLDDIEQYTDAKVLFNNADLHFLRELRALDSQGGGCFRQAHETRDRELAVMRRVDAILSYNETEHEIIASHLMRSDHIFKCPWVLNDLNSAVPYTQRTGIAFVGGFGHPPNAEAVEYFVTQVMPLLRQATRDADSPLYGETIQLHVYGSKVTEDITALGCDDVIIEGFVESLDTVFDQCRVFVAPLLSGAGVKGKVLDSVAYRVPAVLSPVALEATGLMPGVNTDVATTPEEWVAHIVSLYCDEPRWNRYRQNLTALATDVYSRANGQQLMARALDYVGIQANGVAINTHRITEGHDPLEQQHA